MGYIYKYRCCGKDCTDYNFCPYCGTKVRSPNICITCGCDVEIEDGQEHCDKHILQLIGLHEGHFGSVSFYGQVRVSKETVLKALRTTFKK